MPLLTHAGRPMEIAKEIIYWGFMALCAWGVWALRPPAGKQ